MKFFLLLFIMVSITNQLEAQFQRGLPIYQQEGYRCYLSFEDIDDSWWNEDTLFAKVDSMVFSYDVYNRLIAQNTFEWDNYDDYYSYHLSDISIQYNNVGLISDSIYSGTHVVYTYNDCLQLSSIKIMHPESETDYQYNPDGKLIYEGFFEYNTTFGKNILHWKKEFVYNDNLLSEMHYDYSSNGTDPFDHYKYCYYYENGNCIIDTVKFLDPDNGWINYKCYTYAYDDMDRLISGYYEYFITTAHIWEYTGRSLYTYDEAGRPLIKSYEEYLGGIWTSGDRSVYMYDEEGNLKYENWESQTIGGSEWLLGCRITNFFEKVPEPIVTQQTVLTISPNPACCVINLEFDAVSDNLIELDIYNETGQIVYRQKNVEVTEGHNNILVTPGACSGKGHVPASYIIRAFGNNFNASGKFILLNSE